MTAADYRQLRQNRERADRAARDLYERVKARRFELLDELHSLNRLEFEAHEAAPDHPATWDAPALCYRKRPGILAELMILENCGAGDLLRFLCASPDEREWAIDGVLIRGGLTDAHGGFVQVAGA